MKLTKCASGHFYDADKYPECPYCNTGLQTDSSIVCSGAAEESPEETPAEPAVPAAAPAGPVAGWLVVLDGEALSLSPKEYDLLFYLVRNRGVALSRERLISQVWGMDFYGDDRTLDTHIKLLRKRLGRLSGRIVTLRGVGYRFEE